MVFCAASVLETFLDGSVCVTLATIALRPVKLSSVGGQREAGRRESTGTVLDVPSLPALLACGHFLVL